MHNLVIAVGLPGSGKSTWFKEHGIAPLSSDLMRAKLFGNAAEQRYNSKVFATIRGILTSRMSEDARWIYIDATNLTRQDRSNWVRIASHYDYKTWAMYFDVPLETCLERNSRRERVVPPDVIERLAKRLQPPQPSEGFDRIITFH